MTIDPSDAALQPSILAHYERAGALLEASFGGDPIVIATYPGGLGRPPHYAILDVPLSTTTLLSSVHRYGALEFCGWAPLDGDETRLRFARILLARNERTSFDRIREAAAALRKHLHADHVDAVLLFDGHRGAALWIPLADAPPAGAVRLWLHRVCARAVAADPFSFTTEPNAVEDGRIHLHVSTNARHRFSALPYSLRGTPDLRVVAPIRWHDLEAADPTDLKAATFAAFVDANGDLFAAETKRIGRQEMPPAAHTAGVDGPLAMGVNSAPRGHVILAAIDILEDGKPRSADAILAEALARGIVPPHTTRKYVYTSLIEYITRQLGHGRRPQIVQDAERNFRVNEPPDDWPDLSPPVAPEADPSLEALIARLQTTSTGEDPTLFEQAVCDVFAHLGFRTRRLGGHGEPDGIADAELGPLAFRALLECKTAKGLVTQPDAAEASKFMPAFGADFGLLVGPDFTDETQVVQELHTHTVTAFTVADLVTLLNLAANPLEVRTVLEPGFASEAIGDLAWERRHGRVKRIATVAALVHREGWNAQCAAAGQTSRANAPHLTPDAAMLVVDQALRAVGSTQSCSREEVTAAFAHLTDPLVGKAVWLDEERSAIVLLAQPDLP